MKRNSGGLKIALFSGQKAIDDIFVYDDLIENCRRRMALLEKPAC